MSDQTAALTPEEIEELRASAKQLVEDWNDDTAEHRVGALIERVLACLDAAEALLERALQENMDLGSIEGDIRAHLGARGRKPE